MGARTRGFTVIELIVAISLILLLLAIVLPALGWAREAARQAACNSNLLQIGTFTALHCEENRGYFPDLIFDKAAGKSGNIVILHQPPWAKTRGWQAYPPEAMICPNDESPQVVEYFDADGALAELATSYGYNIALTLGNPQPRMQSLRQPAATVLFYDGDLLAPTNGNGQGQGQGQGQGAYHGNAFDWANDTAKPRHYNAPNVLFADGHTEQVATITQDMIYADGLTAPTTPGGGGGGGGKK